jgi:hypothetical protein
VLAGAACLVGYTWLDVWLFETVVDDGGASADYGVAYRYKADAMRKLVRENRGTQIRLGADVRFREPAPPEYRFLVWNERGADQTALGRARVGYVVAESFDGTAPALRPLERRSPVRRDGPVQVGAVPLAGNRG